MKTFELKPLTLAMAIVAVPAFAQEADTSGDASLEEITVTGSYAGSLAKALDTKRDSAGMVDSILAEDIADFPDQNLAESLQRIPGVAIDRDGGQGRGITVRGLNSTFTRVQINGMQAQSLAAGSGGVQTSRGFDFNVFASELFNRLDVYKSTSAELEEGSLGATVALRTARPFDYDPVTVVANVQGSYNDGSEEFTPRTSALVSFTNEEQTLGALFSVAFSERNVFGYGADTGRWEDDNFGSCSACGDDEAEFDRVKSAWHPRIPRYMNRNYTQDRLGVTSSLQWQIADSTLLSFDGLYSNLDSQRTEPNINPISLARTGDTGNAETDVAAYTIDRNNNLITATMDGVDTRAENFLADWGSEFAQYSLTLEHDFSEDFHVKVLAGGSDSQLDNRESTLVLEHFSENDPRRMIDYAESNDTVTYDYTNMTSPDIAFGFDVTDPANWELSEIRDRLYDAESSTSTFRIDLDYALNDMLTLRGGVTQKSYGYEIAGLRADTSLSGADARDGVEDGEACGIGSTITSDMGSVANPTGLPYFKGDLALVDAALASGCWPHAVRAGDTRDVEEESLGVYAQVDFDTDVAGRRLHGNVGVRTVETELTSTGLQNGAVEVTVENDYRDTLPSLNLAYEVLDDVVVRGSAAKVMSRPNLGTLNPGGSVGIFGDPTVSYGNPFIEPFRAKAYDLGAEWYFAENAVVSVAYFVKDIESLPISQTDILSWAETGLPDSLLGAQYDDLYNADFEVKRTVNGEKGGELDGWELQYQQPLTFLPGPEWVRNFGVIANLTKVSSEVTYRVGQPDEFKGPLSGQSDDSSNLTLYWENDDFSARLSVANRGEYSTRPQEASEEKRRYVDATSFLDFSASYRVNDNLKVNFEAINLTDEPVFEYMDGNAKRMITEISTGAQYFVGAQYKF
ncbi:TonB-dependent receptor [Microbulbifer sp. YPW1]|uniref:TonB-dependent receptor n=1 Tax=Microbulbifer sp. YPW1 TaxID=2745199 RepID=UPI00159B8042|nr:TonB-dependent receptor [Microbulbifer sp. YPW1]QKX16977.1 TonB-dependent receptor [Microbulbifer sp. YPW1]